MQQPDPVDVLILGLGWTSTFLLPRLEQHNPPLSHAGTTRDGRDGSVPFNFDPADVEGAKKQLLKTPLARTVLITFPVRGPEAIETLLEAYASTHPGSNDVRYVLLGATTIWKGDRWHDESSPHDKNDARGQAEDWLLHHLGSRGVVLNLAGLYGGQRHPKSWLVRVAKSKEAVKGKGAVHLIHGEDVARAVILSIVKWTAVAGNRWILTDGWSYDWWGLFVTYGRETREGEGGKGLEYERWVFELLEEEGAKGLPRDKERLGRLIDGRGFWQATGDVPRVGRVV